MNIYFSEQRYFAFDVGPDLFGQPVVTIWHGGRFNNIGRVITKPVRDAEASAKEIHARRLRRGYRKISAASA